MIKVKEKLLYWKILIKYNFLFIKATNNQKVVIINLFPLPATPALWSQEG